MSNDSAKLVAKAFVLRQSAHHGNCRTDGSSILVYGHRAIWRGTNGIYVTLAGYPTRAMRQLINAMLEEIGIKQKFITLTYTVDGMKMFRLGDLIVTQNSIINTEVLKELSNNG